LYKKKEIILDSLDKELKKIQEHRRVSLEHAQMNLAMGNEMYDAGVPSFFKKWIKYFELN
jgi:hypothetical protein